MTLTPSIIPLYNLSIQFNWTDCLHNIIAELMPGMNWEAIQTYMLSDNERRITCMHRPFRFGVVAAYTPSHTAWIRTARRVEELGYAALLMPDRVSMGSLAPLAALAVASEVTTSLRIGSYVFCNEYRHPVLLAREAATLD